MMSFPFDVNFGNGGIKLFDSKDPGKDLTLVYNTHFMIQRYDEQKRANSGLNVDENWVNIRDNLGAHGVRDAWDENILPAGTPCRIAVKLTSVSPNDTVGASEGRFSLDFHARNSDNITELFRYGTKGYDLTFAKSPFFNTTGYSEGWNAIGGLNSSNFVVQGSIINKTVKFHESNSNSKSGDRTIHYRTNDYGWSEIDLDSEVGTLRPYAAIFVQTHAQSALNRSNDDGGFEYYSDGLNLGSVNGSPIFRSLQNYSKDIIGLQLIDAQNNSEPSNIYFKFDEGLSNFYKSSEDGIRLQTQSLNRPILWSLSKGEGTEINYEIFSNSLPKGDNEVAIGINLPAAGEYVFSLREVANEAIESAVLWDKVTNQYTELLTNNYSFQSTGSVNTEDRFVIFFGRSITSIPTVTNSEIYAYVDNNILTVKNLTQGDKVHVFDLTARIIASGIASGDTFSTALNQKGVYVVKIGGKTLKVLNK